VQPGWSDASEGTVGHNASGSGHGAALLQHRQGYTTAPGVGTPAYKKAAGITTARAGIRKQDTGHPPGHMQDWLTCPAISLLGCTSDCAMHSCQIDSKFRTLRCPHYKAEVSSTRLLHHDHLTHDFKCHLSISTAAYQAATSNQRY
jgi:hypothetical protein